MNKILAFLQAHKVSSHTIAAALLGFFALYTSDQQFASWLNGIVAHWPKLSSGLAVAAGLYLRYSSSQKVPNG